LKPELENSRIAELLREQNRLLRKIAGEGKVDLAELSKEEHDKLVELKVRDTNLQEIAEFHEKEIEPKLREEKQKREFSRYATS